MSFEKATSLDARNAEAWYNRGMVFCSLERYEDAVDSLEKALEIDHKVQSLGTTKELPLSSLAVMLRPDLLLLVRVDWR